MLKSSLGKGRGGAGQSLLSDCKVGGGAHLNMVNASRDSVKKYQALSYRC